jgi:hypothetical protein
MGTAVTCDGVNALIRRSSFTAFVKLNSGFTVVTLLGGRGFVMPKTCLIVSATSEHDFSHFLW